jgi:hypothetical protein
LFGQFAQDRHQAPKFTRSSPPRGNCSSGVADDLNQTPDTLNQSLANRPMIQIVQFKVQTEFPYVINRQVANPQ